MHSLCVQRFATKGVDMAEINAAVCGMAGKLAGLLALA